jgi:hypothetical protein
MEGVIDFMEPTPFPAPQKSRGNYFVGLVLGFIPLILFLVGFSPNLTVLISVSILLWLAVLIAAIVSLFIQSIRSVGYGLLTAFLVTPVVAYIGCVVIVTRVYHY